MIGINKEGAAFFKNITILLIVFDFVISVYWLSIAYILMLFLIFLRTLLKNRNLFSLKKINLKSFPKSDLFLLGFIITASFSAYIVTPSDKSILFSRVNQIERIRSTLRLIQDLKIPKISINPDLKLKSIKKHSMEFEFSDKIDSEILCATTARSIITDGPIKNKMLIDKLISIITASNPSYFCKIFLKAFNDISNDEIKFLSNYFVLPIGSNTGRNIGYSKENQKYAPIAKELYGNKFIFDIKENQVEVKTNYPLNLFQCFENITIAFSSFEYFKLKQINVSLPLLVSQEGKILCGIFSENNQRLKFKYMPSLHEDI